VSDVRDPESDQPLPRGNELPVMHRLVQEDLEDRLRLGLRKYGQPLQPYNGRSFLLDLYGEVLDAAVYLRGRIYEDEHPAPSSGRAQLRDRLAELLVITAHPGLTPEKAVAGHLWGAEVATTDRAYWLERAETLLISEPFRQAIDTIHREGIERGASPALQILLVELQDSPGGTPRSFETGYQQGILRAIELISEEAARDALDAFEAGRKLGREERRA